MHIGGDIRRREGIKSFTVTVEGAQPFHPPVDPHTHKAKGKAYSSCNTTIAAQ